MGFGIGNMMGSLSPFWMVLSFALMITLILGVVITILGIVKYSDDKKEGKLMVWGIALLLVPLLVWGIVMTTSSNDLFDSNHNIDNYNMMTNY